MPFCITFMGFNWCFSSFFTKINMSQISLPGKLLEKIVHLQLYNYFQLNNILSDKQLGFRKGLSTSLAIFDVLKELYSNWNDKCYSGCAFIDFSRAFDSINHKILFEKLKLYGVVDKSLKFFKEYMGNRRQKTCVNGFASQRGSGDMWYHPGVDPRSANFHHIYK